MEVAVNEVMIQVITQAILVCIVLSTLGKFVDFLLGENNKKWINDNIVFTSWYKLGINEPFSLDTVLNHETRFERKNRTGVDDSNSNVTDGRSDSIEYPVGTPISKRPAHSTVHTDRVYGGSAGKGKIRCE